MHEIIIYSDESRHRGERFLLLGGLWIRADDIVPVENKIRQIRKNRGYHNSAGKWVDFRGEFKWTKVSDKYLRVYKDVIDLFLSYLKRLRFVFV